MRAFARREHERRHLRGFADAGAIVVYMTHNEQDVTDADRIIALLAWA